MMLLVRRVGVISLLVMRRMVVRRRGISRVGRVGVGGRRGARLAGWWLGRWCRWMWAAREAMARRRVGRGG